MTTVGLKYPSLISTSSREYLSMLERVNEPTEIYPIENLKLILTKKLYILVSIISKLIFPVFNILYSIKKQINKLF